MWCADDSTGFSHVGHTESLSITVTCVGASNTLTADNTYPVNAAAGNGGGSLSNTQYVRIGSPTNHFILPTWSDTNTHCGLISQTVISSDGSDTTY